MSVNKLASVLSLTNFKIFANTCANLYILFKPQSLFCVTVYLSAEFAIRLIDFGLIFKLCNVVCIMYVTQKLSNLFL